MFGTTIKGNPADVSCCVKDSRVLASRGLDYKGLSCFFGTAVLVDQSTKKHNPVVLLVVLSRIMGG